MTIKPEFMIEWNGKAFVLYGGLLAAAHDEGLKRITVTVVQVPGPENGNVAICTAEVETAKGVFSEVGDAEPGNVNRMVAAHLLRMAATRAKARALRDAVNVGVTALEELGPETEETQRPPRRPVPSAAPAARASVQTDPTRELRQSGAILRESPPHQEPSPHDASLEGLDTSGPPAQWPTPAPPAQVATPRPLASPKQLETIARMARAAGKSVDTNGLTRAQASDVISRLIEEYGERRAS